MAKQKVGPRKWWGLGIRWLPSEKIGSGEDITFGEDIPWGEGGPRKWWGLAWKCSLGEDGPRKICVPKDGYWAGRRWGQRIVEAWVKDILKEKMGKEKMCPWGWIMGRENVSFKKWWGLGKRWLAGWSWLKEKVILRRVGRWQKNCLWGT